MNWKPWRAATWCAWRGRLLGTAVLLGLYCRLCH
jgi:hypothetical protein